MKTDFLPAAALLLLGLLLAGPVCGADSDVVKLWQADITLPTYQVAPPDPNPRFYEGRTYQGARATFYPYPVMDRLTDDKADRVYKAIYLENPYIQISVLPELGGRIFSAVDKSNGYDFFYRQHVIKPALIGMLGAWISGGVEWNVPHHHRATSFMPVDHTTTSQADGSKTIWVGETELRHRLRWSVGLTIYPDRSYIEMSMKVANPTPLAHPILFWINPAVHANDQYQVIFPPSTEWAVQHSKPEFASWPIARQVYGGNDYTRGVDISWWKNHSSPVSFFAWNCEEDWFGGYDHGKQAGVLQWSDHRVAPGKKFFEWGNGPEGEMWSQVLSDSDGPYLELMAGAWSDNQPDYSWLGPGEVREWKHWWYPIREMGGAKSANRDAALNLEVKEGSAHLAINTTREYPQAKVRVESRGRPILETAATISPTQPFSADVSISPGGVAEDIRVDVRDGSGAELLAYQPAQAKGTAMPKPVERPKSPREYASIDELFYTGQRIEQLYSPAFEPDPYYEEIIRRDPGEYRANTALGLLLCRQWRWQEAGACLSNAVGRAAAQYIRPKDGEAFYYLGVALQAQGQAHAAEDAFSRAAWTQGWKAVASRALAELECGGGQYARALAHIDESLAVGGRNPKAAGLKATLLRKIGRLAEAEKFAASLVQADPLDFRALNELAVAQHEMGSGSDAAHSSARLAELMQGSVQSYLELALDYGGQSFWTEAADVLRQIDVPSARRYPMVHYCQAHFALRSGRPDEAAAWYQSAAEMPAQYCFPSRYEEAVILREALEENPADARAAYYLGNAYYDQQPGEAIELWQRARELDPAFAPVHRNLGFAYAQHEKDAAKAILCLEKAVELNSADPRFYYELDVQLEAAGASVAKRLGFLSRRPDVVEQRDDATTRLVVLLTASGRSDEAMRLLTNRHFHNWEGSGALHDVYVNACIGRGLTRLQAGDAAAALLDFQAALEYPHNQEVGRSRREQRVAEIHYRIGLAREALGQSSEAASAFQRAARARESGDGQYFRGLALQKLGKADEANGLFERLVTQGMADLERSSEAVDYFAKFGEKRAERLRRAQAEYLAGLGCLGQGRRDAAAARFARAVELNPAHLGALEHGAGR